MPTDSLPAGAAKGLPLSLLYENRVSRGNREPPQRLGLPPSVNTVLELAISTAGARIVPARPAN